jgi:hypothetical protein
MTRLSRVSWWEEPVSIGWWVKLQWVLFPNATLLHGVSIPSCQGSPSVDPMPVQEYAWMGSVVRNVRTILEDIQTVRFASSVFLFLGCIQLSAKGFNLSFQEN